MDVVIWVRKAYTDTIENADLTRHDRPTQFIAIFFSIFHDTTERQNCIKNWTNGR
jgi:hypothetical protein